MDRATGLLLISMVDDKEIDPAVRTLLLSSLRHSGYEVEDMLIHAPGRRRATAIHSVAPERSSDLLVAGGFGYSRFREFILDGVTRDLLSACESPLLLAH